MNSIETARHMNLFQQASLLNADGVECLTRCDGEGAYRSFKRALQVVTIMTREMEDQNDAPKGPALEFWPSSKPVPRLQDDCYYVYNHGLVFASPSTPTQHNMAFCAAVIIFNIALTYHQRGLPKASSLYEQVATIVRACTSADQDTTVVSYDENAHVLQLIARNNHTHTLKAMGQLDLAQEGLEDLQELLYSVRLPEVCNTTLHPSLLITTSDVLEELALNVLVPGTTVVAAAA